MDFLQTPHSVEQIRQSVCKWESEEGIYSLICIYLFVSCIMDQYRLYCSLLYNLDLYFDSWIQNWAYTTKPPHQISKQQKKEGKTFRSHQLINHGRNTNPLSILETKLAPQLYSYDGTRSWRSIFRYFNMSTFGDKFHCSFILSQTPSAYQGSRGAYGAWFRWASSVSPELSEVLMS